MQVKNNIGLLPDLDVRSARRAFNKKYPGEQQQMLRLKEVTLSENGMAETLVTSIKDLTIIIREELYQNTIP